MGGESGAADERGLVDCIESRIEANPHYAVAAIFSLAIGASLGAAGARGNPVVAGLAYSAALIAYALYPTHPARFLALSLLVGTHTGFLLATGSHKIVAPFLVIERGPIGSSVYPDIAQVLLAYEAVQAVRSCTRNAYKDQADALAPGQTQEVPR